MKRIRVLLADDNRLLRKEFRKILDLENDLEVVGEAKNGHEAVVMVKELRPEIILMDVAMPLMDGLSATRQILKASPGVRILMFSEDGEEAYVEAALNSGSLGYLIKQTCADNVCQAIRTVHQGKIFLSPSISSQLKKRRWSKKTARVQSPG